MGIYRKSGLISDKELSVKVPSHRSSVLARLIGVPILSLASLFVALPVSADELITLATRPEVTQSALNNPITRMNPSDWG